MKRLKAVMIWGQFHKLIYALRPAICALHPTFEKLFIGAKVRRKAQKIGVGCKTVYEIDPWFLQFGAVSYHLVNHCHEEKDIGKILGKLPTKSHYRVMAWLPFQK